MKVSFPSIFLDVGNVVPNHLRYDYLLADFFIAGTYKYDRECRGFTMRLKISSFESQEMLSRNHGLGLLQHSVKIKTLPLFSR